MVLSVIAHIFALLLELVRISRISDHDKDLEILVLRYQLGIADRKLNRTIKPERIEKLTLAVLAARLKSSTNRTTNQQSPILRPQVQPYGRIQKRKVLGGIINDYYRAPVTALV